MTLDRDHAIECESLGRIYRSGSIPGRGRETAALTDLTMRVPKGGVFGLLGPNGAGKTTTIRILSTLLTPTSGSASVLGHDVVKQAKQVRERIGFILGGDRGLYGRLTGKQNVRYFGALNRLNPRTAQRRADELLERVGLSGAAETLVEEYSRGMKQRLHIARGLLTDPEVIFMDEPTIGLDPMGAQELRQYIPELVGQGKTILLTTHYMLEADMLCDNIALIDHGRLVALGTPDEIKRNFSRVTVIEIVVNQTRETLAEELSNIGGVRQVETSTEGIFQKITITVQAGVDAREQIENTVGSEKIESLVVRDPTLEQAYVSILR